MTSDPTTGVILSIAQTVACTEAEGPGKRFAVWFQGCPLRCPGCCNPEFLPFKGGEEWA
ncbi:MAG TPA: 4Fe-4S cluster-binding domain-containing protein, partial [Gemmataceae bacterium]